MNNPKSYATTETLSNSIGNSPQHRGTSDSLISTLDIHILNLQRDNDKIGVLKKI